MDEQPIPLSDPDAVSTATCETLQAQAAWSAVSAAFGALGRAFICVNADFRVLHVSHLIESAVGRDAAGRAEGRPLEELFGTELFGPAGTLRMALLAGERREGWRAHLRVGDGEPLLVSLTAAPFPQIPGVACDPRVKYIIVLRPTEQDRGDTLGAPTGIGGLVARSAAMARVFALIENLRHTEATVLITGESGTGKELVARVIHDLSPRHKGPFVAVNCGALPLELLESEMFGHTRGAFTGAVRDRIGRFEAATDGTLFLDEVGDLPLPLQVKLLRVLQDGTFERLGENHTRVSRARVVAATNVELPRAVREGRFRDDLFYRLRVVPIYIPPLRHRREDIEPLAQILLARVGARHGRALRFSPETLRILLQQDWLGNVRELENVIEYGVTVCRGQTMLPEDLPEPSSTAMSSADPSRAAERSNVSSPVPVPPGETEDEREIRRALDAHRWNRRETAESLGISRVTLWRKMRALELS